MTYMMKTFPPFSEVCVSSWFCNFTLIFSIFSMVQIDLKEKQLKRRLDDEERKDRSIEEMAQEAAEYRKLLS